MKKVLVGILALVGVLSILAVVLVAGLGVLSLMGKPGVPGRVILEVDLEAGVIEVIPDDPMAQMMMEGYLEVRDVVEALDRASSDSRVKALIARIGGAGMGMAHIQEIRDAVMRFRASGKPAIAFAETFGEFGSGNGGYYLATAFDEIYMQPSGDVGLTGLNYETMFLRGTLDKLGVTPRMDQRHEYKNAMNSYTERRYTEPHREGLSRVMDSRFDQIVRGIAQAREIPEGEVRALIDQGPFLGGEALEAGLIDGLSYRDEAYELAKEAGGCRAKLLYLDKYLDRAGRPHKRGETVALIHGYGGVMRGRGGYSPIDGSVYMGSDSVTAAFRAAIDDRRVKAILFRVDSPGGSYVASDTIWRETTRAREAGKPVIVSMGNLAGSGGYFVAMNADRIVAQPGTITASIGVFGGKMLTRGFWNKLGVTWDDVRTSKHSALWSTHHDYEGSGYERFQATLDRIYEDFTEKVAAGRDLDLDQVLELARGRIWTGEDAKELGLVDELGGYETALRLVREAIGVEPDAPIRIKRFPRKRSTWELFLGQPPDSSEDAAIRALARALKGIQPTVRVLKRLGLIDEPVGLIMPEVTGATP